MLNKENKCKTGVPGLDELVKGGLPRNHLYLLQGKPGTGKTTLAMQFLLQGVKEGEKVLYITFSETKAELEAVAHSHAWDISGISFMELSTISSHNSSMRETTLFHPSEVELTSTMNLLLDTIKKVQPKRVVFDSVSELQLLSDSSLRYRRQMLAFKEFFIGRGITVLFLDDLTTESGDIHVQSIVHGVMLLEKLRAGYGAERRQFHIAKLRGVEFKSGTHDYLIKKGGIQIFPRLISGDYAADFEPEVFSSGVKQLDSLLGGGLDRGTSNLILGPAGTGKSTICLRFAISAAENGKKVAIYSFEESPTNLRMRAKALNMNLEKHLKAGTISLRKIDPAELTPGQFTSLLRETADLQGADMIVVDSLNGYIHAMPEQQFLILQLHELLSYLGSKGIVTLMVLAQAGIMGSMNTPLDLTYLADSVIVTRYFEAFGSVKKAISVIKKRTGYHEESLRELRVGESGVIVGDVLKEFSGIFTGVPQFMGEKQQIMKSQDGE